MLAVVWLRDQEIVDVNAKLLGIARVKRVLGVNERGEAAILLGFSDDLKSDGGLAGGLRSEDLDDTSAGHTTHSKRCVERDGPGGDNRDGNNGFLRPKAHDRALAKLLFEL